MIVGLITLFAVLFGGGAEVFFIDEINKGVKKSVVDKERKDEILSVLKEGEQKIKEFKKEAAKSANELKRSNYDRFLEGAYFINFFADRISSYGALQLELVEVRLKTQSLINDDEWAQIMTSSSKAQFKQDEKIRKQEAKEKSTDVYRKLEKAINTISNQETRGKILASLNDYRKSYDAFLDSYENLNVNESATIANRNATREDLIKFGKDINGLREEMIESYLKLFFSIRENATVDSYKSIIKELNKLVL